VVPSVFVNALLGDSYQRDAPAFLETLADIVLDGLVRSPTPISDHRRSGS
jgi:hypothetical protein